jgi:hypothetical protein
MNSRLKFVLIFLMFSIPFVGSTLAFLFWKPASTSNYGELISPVISLPESALAVLDPGAAGDDELRGSLRGKWLMLTRDGGACETPCQKKLYAMRQARLILGREQDRVIRVLLVDDDVLPSEELRKRYTGTVWLSARRHPWLKLLPTTVNDNQSGRANIFGVDPLGNVFIRYGGDPDIKRLNLDFQRVLKASQIG